jgi:hypothetical protein
MTVEFSLLLGASYFGFGTFLPPAGDRGFWFYTAILAVIFAARLDTPYFTTPADAVLYSAPAAVALLLVNHWAEWGVAERCAYVAAVVLCTTVAAAGVTAILAKDSIDPRRKRLSDALRIVCEFVGTPQFIFSLVLLAALVIFHRHSPRQLLAIGTAWFLTVGLSPAEKGALLLKRLHRALGVVTLGAREGEMVAFQFPGLLLIRTDRGTKASPGDLLLVNDPLTDPKIALALDYVGRDEGVLLRAIEVATVTPDEADFGAYAPNAVVLAPESITASSSLDLIRRRSALAGFVAPDTAVDRLFFEVTRDDGLEEGRLVETVVGSELVTYQVVNGFTKEEVVHQKNTYGYVRAQAQKIGRWDNDRERFAMVKWMPRANAPVFLNSNETYMPRADAVGHFPGTNYPLRLGSIDSLVTHNTAILGILGVGKSSLALELVERMIDVGVKVLVLDLTNQYSRELATFFDSDLNDASATAIRAAGDHDREAWAENPEQGGSIVNLMAAFHDDIGQFLGSDQRLKIYNPARITGTKQNTEPRSFNQGGEWRRGAALWSISPVEVTRIVTETVLDLLQGDMCDTARVCLIYEEAHSLIPEWNSVASEADRVATNATARAILQGRKYGLGCLVVTQRTASVTKTILNQCNTVFAMRIFDETGKEFLANYVGRDYANALPSLSERHAVFFGKASSCENPVLIRLNDRDEFVRAFRKSSHQNIAADLENPGIQPAKPETPS